MPKCIVADDSSIIRSVINIILTNRGFDVVETDNGDETVYLYNQMKDDLALIILDYEISGTNGLDILYKIRSEEEKTDRRVSIIMSSFVTSEKRIRDALDGGADDYLMRPFDGDILNSKLEHLGVMDE
ncbi:MAG: response regulator [Lactobacillaceae bacterium]|nr:response regulator [Lactobacillaceae bacterium]